MNAKNIDFVLLIPCYNNISGLSASLESISYPFAKFEVLIVDDGSIVPITKNNLQIPNEMIVDIIRLDRNLGVVPGLMVLKSRSDLNYIARLDAGDTCNEKRFQKQVDFLNENDDIAIVASWARFQEAASTNGYDYITETTHEKIVKEMHYKCSFIHPSVMFKKEVLDKVGLYPITYPHAEDYAFFWKILKYYKGAVLPEKLVQIGYSDTNVSAENYKKQLHSRKTIVKEFGDNWLDKRIGIELLNLKLILPRKIIQKIKSTLK
jgi:glycosyltransferase involved in cell wall biosynthesis